MLNYRNYAIGKANSKRLSMKVVSRLGKEGIRHSSATRKETQEEITSSYSQRSFTRRSTTFTKPETGKLPYRINSLSTKSATQEISQGLRDMVRILKIIFL